MSQDTESTSIQLAQNVSVSNSPEQRSSSSSEGETSDITTTPLTSTPPSEAGDSKEGLDTFSSATTIAHRMKELFDENVTAKVLRTAVDHIGSLPYAFPEFVPQDSDGRYVDRESEFWTCGFFPGTLYAILERLIKYPHSLNLAALGNSETINVENLRSQISTLCRSWTEPLHGMAGRTDTHDIGFIVMPALRADWELTGNPRSLNSIIHAAESLASRYVPSARAIRSWDLIRKKDIVIVDQEENMLVIIDSLCNLDLLYYAASHVPGGDHLAEIATAHAATLLETHLRKEKTTPISKEGYSGQWYSTCHVANLHPKTGDLKFRFTNQGYAHESTWARGQAWGILGYAQTYISTKDTRFLHASCGLAEYFLYRLETSPACVKVTVTDSNGRESTRGCYTPLWDFDAPTEDTTSPLRDSSAGAIAANGMVLLAQALNSISQHGLATRFLRASIDIVEDLLAFALAPERTKLVNAPYQHIQAVDEVPNLRFEGLLKFGTANNNSQAKRRYADHGLVYGDYYLVEFGNKLQRMGYV